MSLVSTLWFLSTMLACWGTAVFARGLRGERIKLRRPAASTPARTPDPAAASPDSSAEVDQPSANIPRPAHQRPKWRPTWPLVLLGFAVATGGFAMGWWAIGISRELDTSFGGQGHITPWHSVAAGLGMFGILLVVWALFGDRARGRFRCSKCWYDLSGLPLSKLPTPCAECGNKIETKEDLTRARRHRKTAGLGLALLLLAGIGLWGVTRGPSPAAAVPHRILAWLYWQGSVPSPWTTEEVNRRGPEHQALADRLAVTWITRTLKDTPESVTGRFVTVSYLLIESEDSDSELNLTFDQVQAAWQAQVRHLLVRSQNPDIHVRWATAWNADRMPGFFLAALARTPEVTPLNEFTDHPALVLGLPEFTADELAQFRVALRTKPDLAVSFPPLLGPQILELCPRAMHDIPTLLASDGSYYRSCYQWIGVSGRASPAILDQAIALLDDPDPRLADFALHTLRVAADAPSQLGLSPEAIASIRAKLQSTDEEDRWRAWRILRNEGLLTAADVSTRSQLPVLAESDLTDLIWIPSSPIYNIIEWDPFALAPDLLANHPNNAAMRPVLNYLLSHQSDNPEALPLFEYLAASTDTDIGIRAKLARDQLVELIQLGDARAPMSAEPEAQPSPNAGDG